MCYIPDIIQNVLYTRYNTKKKLGQTVKREKEKLNDEFDIDKPVISTIVALYT